MTRFIIVVAVTVFWDRTIHQMLSQGRKTVWS